MANSARVIGIHPITADEPVHLVELEIVVNTEDFNFGEITQELQDQPRSNWQTVYDLRELEGESGRTRFVFFFHYLDTTRSLLSPVGPLDLPPESPVPEYLQGFEYEQP